MRAAILAIVAVFTASGCATSNPKMRVTFTFKIAGEERLRYDETVGLKDAPVKAKWKEGGK